MTKKQIIYVSALLNVILVSFLTGYIINSKNNDTNPNVPLTEQSETTSTTEILSQNQESEEKELTAKNQRVVPKSISPKFESKELGISFSYTTKFIEPVSKIYNTPGISNPDFIGEIYVGHKESSEYWKEIAKTSEIIEGGPDSITIQVYKNTERLEPTDWVIANENSLGIYTNYNPEFATKPLSKIKVDGFDAVAYSWYGLGGADEVVIYNTDTNLIYKISAGYMSEESEIRTLLKEFITAISFI